MRRNLATLFGNSELNRGSNLLLNPHRESYPQSRKSDRHFRPAQMWVADAPLFQLSRNDDCPPSFSQRIGLHRELETGIVQPRAIACRLRFLAAGLWNIIGRHG